MKIKFLKALMIISIFNFSFVSISLSSVDGVNRLHSSLWGENLEHGPVFLNLISTMKFRADLMLIISTEPQYDLMKEMLESEQMILEIESFFESYFDKYAQIPKESTAIRYADTFVQHLQRIFGIRYQDEVVRRLNSMILNVLLPKRRNNICQSYLYSI